MSHVYYLDNLSCANCAQKFENNLKALPGVRDAQVNFMAGKVVIEGQVTVADIEEAGAFDKIKVKSSTKGSIEDTEIPSHLFAHLPWPLGLSALAIILALVMEFGFHMSETSMILVYVFAIMIGGYELFLEGLKNLGRLSFDMTTLMTVSIIGAALIGEWQEAAIVVILFAVSEALERYSMDQARQSLSHMMALAPETATLLENGHEVTKHVSDIHVNDILIVKPGQRIAMDGEIVSGTTTINQAAITGESIPVYRTLGEAVFAGTLNEEGLIQVKVSHRQEDNTLSKIIQLVEDAQNAQAPTQSFINRFAKYYTPMIMGISLLIMLVPPLFFEGNWHHWLYQGLSLLIIGCPCALVISTPVAIVTAIGNVARNGVLIKGGIHLENLGHTQVVAFDKTGTLTQGKPQVYDDIILDQEVDTSEILYHLEHLTTHPLGQAVVTYLESHQDSVRNISLENVSTLTGQGIQGDYQGVTYYAGSPKLFEHTLKMDLTPYQSKLGPLLNEGKTVILFGNQARLMRILSLGDSLRPGMKANIDRLNHLGIETLMLTGDHQKVAQAIGNQLGISRIEADQMPEDKLGHIKDLSQHTSVVMVGDGVNDAPALAAATVGVSMGTTGTDTAMETADVVLMSDDISRLPYSIELSQHTLRIIKQNIAFALGLKLLALLLVIPGWLTMWMAILSDIGATVLVILNSLRLMKQDAIHHHAHDSDTQTSHSEICQGHCHCQREEGHDD